MNMVHLILKILFASYLLITSFRSYADPSYWSLINNVNLIFHEAGHALTIFFGELINIFGGTLFEFGIPLSITFYFIVKRQWYGAVFASWWTSTAFYGISIYAGDAIVRQLPLLGGDGVYHDWFTLLTKLDALRYTKEIEFFFFTLSIVFLCLALYLLYFDLKTFNQKRSYIKHENNLLKRRA